MNSRLRSTLFLLLLFLIAWLPRALALDAFVTPDERKWLARSANFTYALSHGEFAETFQREHPGVTVMWAGTVGLLTSFPEYPQLAPGYFTWERENFEAWVLENTPHTPLDLLVAGRRWIALGVALLLWLAIFPLRRLIGPNAAYLAFFFLALDPFSVALSRQLHPDGFEAGFTFLALLYFLAWLYAGRRWRDVVMSGIVMGLAWLTKTPAALLVPAGTVLVGIELWQVWRPRQDPDQNPHLSDRDRRPSPLRRSPFVPAKATRRLLGGYVIWGLVASAAFIVLWPAMWSDPVNTLTRMATEMEAYVEGHVNPNYFWGRPTGDPGWFFYPVAYFFRITPAVVVGLVAAVIARIRLAWPFPESRTRHTLRGLAIFSAVFIVFMSIPAKKFDRYILPAFLALDVVAAVGWLALAQVPWKNTVAPWRQRLRLRTPAVIVLAGFVFHGLFTVATFPYYLTYYNPLAGGSWAAPRVLFVGWGEGLDEAARWLNEQPNAADTRVAAWYADGPLSYYLDGQAVPMGYSSPLSWLDTDYVVTYVNQWQRQIPSPEAVAWFEEQTPAKRVDAGGIELARVYDLRETLLPPFIDLNTSAAADFGDKIRLVGVDIPAPILAPGGEMLVTLYLQALAPMEVNYNVLVRLLAPDGSELWREEGWPWGAPTTNWPVRDVRPDGRTVTIPLDARAGLYQLVVSFYDPATFAPLPAVDVRSGQPLASDGRDVALLAVGAAGTSEQPRDVAWHYGDLFALSGVTLPATVRAGETLSVSLQWDSLAITPVDYTTFLHVLAPGGDMVAQLDKQPLDGFAPTHTWLPGTRLEDRFVIDLPAGLAPGTYSLHAGMYVGDTRLPVKEGDKSVGDSARIGSVEVE
ncbi:MAG: glycosyltransferase family 39 protein [Caldilineaceae bacterium]|nr:glycosyltransferase family 39 protein [Caldilineaceae bacterium]